MDAAILNQLAEAVVGGKVTAVEELSNKVLAEGLDPYEAIIDGLAKGMVIVSDRYEKGEAFVPHLLVASKAMYKGMDILSPHIKSQEGHVPAVGVIGSIEGDVHDIGKNLVKTMLSAAGFNMIDLGADVPIEKFVEVVKENKADLLSMSALMTTTMVNMEKVIEMLQEEGIRDAMTIMVGGAPVSEEFAASIGADSTHNDAMLATDWAKEAVKAMSPSADRWSDVNIGLAKVKYREILSKKKVKSKTDVGLETAKEIIAEFEQVAVKDKEEMSHMDRTLNAMGDKKVDRLPVYPLACGSLRKFANVSYKEYALEPNAFRDSAFLGTKYLDTDMFVGLIDLSATSSDFGCKIKYPEDDTPSSEGHLDDYEKIEVPDVRNGTRSYELIQASKIAKEKLNKELNVPFVGFHEGPLLTLTQLMGADRVLMDMKTNPDVVLEAVQKCTDYICQVSELFFEEDACNALCIDNLWSNNVIMDEADYWKFDGKFVYDQHLPIFKEYDQPYIIHNCADAVHYDTQITKFGTQLYSYAYYPKLRGKGSQGHMDLIPKYGQECCMMGEINPVDLMDGSPEGVQKIKNDTEQLLRSVLPTLKDNGLQSKFVMSTGCETPPAGPLSTVKAMVDVVKELGPSLQKEIIG
ncbi:uroporphyrinogen decarboxylase family protein [Methanolobus sp. ZRKC3]|uniref:uroporphyrinogen decarboxylase family protein n=1 Tax=Methanolobus sp. ZRKC3 TaxID=3125786 RepID=UPI0032520EE8